ncbi:MAG: helix-turn-helix domain-containing protein [Hyphomicrobiaceae bacterium]
MSRIATKRQSRERERLLHIGEAIRAARKERRMTLDALAGEVGLSVTFLSRLERGQVACSIGNLLEIAAVLELAPAQLFADLEDGARAKAFRVVRRADANPSAADRAGPYAWTQLASGIGEQRMEAFLLDLPAGAKNAPLVTHPGEEFCIVLEGVVEFRVGDEVVTLDRGDSIHLRSDVPHMAWAKGRSRAQLLMVTAIESQSATAVEWWARMPKSKLMVEAQASERKTPGKTRTNRT